MALEDYNKKRDFGKSPEPKGELEEDDLSRFVIQRHEATRLHYDLRLEMDGVLKSWAVPKGPSMNPGDKRLAIHTEDHPVKYLSFQGNIPKGNYGAGNMKIWDEGCFHNAKENIGNLQKQYEDGNLKIQFEGSKIKGEFALVHTKSGKAENQWLLIKKKDRYATDLDYDAETFAEISSKKRAKGKLEKLNPETPIKPMLASSTKKIFNSPDWIYELKWDGYRMITHISEKGVFIFSRNGISYNSVFPALVKDLSHISHDTILDGEVVVVDKEGLPQFHALQNYEKSPSGELRYFVFDMLYLNGHSMISLPVIERKSLIPEVIENTEKTSYCDHVEGMGTAFYNKAIEAGMEGVIAKKANSTYSPGIRSEDWLKIKSIESEEALICGYTDSVTGGAQFGSLILGMYKEGKLEYVGNCGSGFSSKEQKYLLDLLATLKTEKNPFHSKLNLKGRKPNWIVPELICEVKFMEKTKNGLFRHPVYKGLRHDKSKQEINHEEIKKQHKPKPPKNKSSNAIEVDGISVPFSNLEKVYWPTSELKKYDLIDYYLKVADVMLPYLKDRPQNLHRHPNGILSPGFYQKDNDSLPEWVKTFSIYSESSKKEIEYLLCQDKATLLYMANLGCIEINPFNSKVNSLDYPDYTVIDLDPSEKNSFEEVIEVAQATKEILDMAKIKAFCKTSGSRGIHIYIPLDAAYSYEEARNFTKLLCMYVQEKIPGLTTMERRIKDRNNKIYLDYLQNRRGQSLAAVYCVRPIAGAPVSTPITWKELKSGLKIADFNIQTVPNRIEKLGDLFEGLLTEELNMENALKNLG